MTARVLPVRAGVPHQQFQVDLDGVPYNFELRWNERAPAWVMALRDASDTPLRQGVRVCLGALLLPHRRSEAFPPGQLLAVDTDGSEVEPGLEDFGESARVRLVYLDAADVVELSSG